MVLRVNHISLAARRAQRLLRLYPKAWRERYGPEFVDLMEQEIAETPRSLRRTSNIISKGVIARFNDAGLTGLTIDTSEQSRAGVATMFVAVVMFMSLALHFWSEGMLNWNALNQASIAVSLWLGAVTTLSVVLAVMILVVFASLVGSAIMKVATGKSKGVRGPLSLVAGMIVLVGYSAHNALQYVIARGGIQWTHPGQAVKQVAGAVYAITDNVIRVWLSPSQQLVSFSDLVYALTPLALVFFASGVATLIRRSEFFSLSNRTGRVATISFATTMVLYLIGWAGWLIATGPGKTIFGGTITASSQNVEYGAMVLMAILAVQITRRLWKTAWHSPAK